MGSRALGRYGDDCDLVSLTPMEDTKQMVTGSGLQLNANANTRYL